MNLLDGYNQDSYIERKPPVDNEKSIKAVIHGRRKSDGQLTTNDYWEKCPKLIDEQQENLWGQHHVNIGNDNTMMKCCAKVW